MENLPILNTSQALGVTFQTKAINATNKDYKELLGYIITLLGIPKDKQPNSLELTLIMNYFKAYLPEHGIEEVKEAFNLAVQKRFVVNLELYGGTLSMKFISDALIAYKAYKRDLLKKLAPKEEGMNNTERLKAITSFLSPELKEEIKQIGEVKQSRPDLPKLQYHDLHQKLMVQFDFLKKLAENKRFIYRYHDWRDMESFVNYKMEQLFRVKEYLKKRNNDQPF